MTVRSPHSAGSTAASTSPGRRGPRGGSADASGGRGVVRAATAALRRLGLLSLGGLFFGLAAVGIVLPGLPTTPFLLLTTFCLVRASPALNARLLRSRMFGPLLTDWQVRGGVRRHVKVKAVVTVVLAVSLSIWFAAHSPLVTFGVLMLAAIGLTVVVRLPEVQRSDTTPDPGTSHHRSPVPESAAESCACAQHAAGGDVAHFSHRPSRYDPSTSAKA